MSWKDIQASQPSRASCRCSTSRISGKVVIGGGKAVEINALPAESLNQGFMPKSTRVTRVRRTAS